MNDERYLLSSISNSMKILDLLGEEEMLGVAEISTKLSMNKTSVFRYLYTLEAGGYVYKTFDAKYMLGKKFVYMASIVEERQSELGRARPMLTELRDTINETVHLSILLPDLDMMFVEKVSSTQSLRMRSKVGYQIPAYQSGSGKVLLAGLMGTEREKEITRIQFEKKTALTIMSHEALLKELKKVQERGYGEENGEAEEGLSCLAVPISNYKNETIAAISISGPTVRLQEHHEEYLKELKKTKVKVERALGL